MKRTDIALLIFIAGISLGIGFYITSSIPLFANSSEEVQVDTVELYENPESLEVSEEVFYDGAINPTILVEIGQGESGSD